MFAKSALLAAIFAASTQLVAATVPPACLIAAVNTRPDPSKLGLICGSDSGKVESAISEACNTAEHEKAAMAAFEDMCKNIGKTVSTSSRSSSSKTTSSESTSTSKSSSDATTSAESSDSTSAPYPIVYTSTFYDVDCSCTKTTAVSSSGVAGSTGFATGTAVPIPTGSGAVGSGAAGSGPGATGSPISPSAPIDSGNAGGAPFTGAASKTVGSLAAAALAFVGLALTL
ncbi:MAG: hypothetical protein LQ337_007349 [Flavoplaca oasis]|nr:MAG: hypothetical protein LQ337_007349 [Flavoplaca oasis]